MKRVTKIYPPKLIDEILKSKLIPRKCKKDEKLKLYHKYWIPDYKEVIKVEEIMTINDAEYYIIRYNGMSGIIPHPVRSFDNIYELLHNYNQLQNDSIINSDKRYTGAEIKFWFIYNSDIFKDKEYEGFLPLLLNNNLVDSRFYFIKKNGNKCYINIAKQ